MPYPVITNDMYQTSLDYLKIHQGYGGQKEVKESIYSLDRFVNTIETLNQNVPDQNDLIEAGLNTLTKTMFEDTQWTIIYHPTKLSICYCSKNSTRLKQIDGHSLDFSPDATRYVKDIDDDQKEFKEYSSELNLELVKFFFLKSNYFRGLKIPMTEVEAFGSFPDTYRVWSDFHQ